MDELRQKLNNYKELIQAEPKCADCDFFKQFDKNEIGQCTFNPPILPNMPKYEVEQECVQNCVNFNFPFVSSDDKCSKFFPKRLSNERKESVFDAVSSLLNLGSEEPVTQPDSKELNNN